jgi:nitrite reductase/ring-hydroxylating ferredoxin subunit
VLRNVGERDSTDLRAGLDRMRADAAARSIPPEELRGATITLSNFGMIGSCFPSLVVVPPQVAIIGAGRAEQRVVVDQGQQVIRCVLPLSLTFDHRVVTGGEAAWYALDNRCPHMGFPLDRGSVEDGILTCHRHHARFDLASGCNFDLWADDPVRSNCAATKSGSRPSSDTQIPPPTGGTASNRE